VRLLLFVAQAGTNPPKYAQPASGKGFGTRDRAATIPSSIAICQRLRPVAAGGVQGWAAPRVSPTSATYSVGISPLYANTVGGEKTIAHLRYPYLKRNRAVCSLPSLRRTISWRQLPDLFHNPRR
jgi:hypothetical protein